MTFILFVETVQTGQMQSKCAGHVCREVFSHFLKCHKIVQIWGICKGSSLQNLLKNEQISMILSIFNWKTFVSLIIELNLGERSFWRTIILAIIFVSVFGNTQNGAERSFWRMIILVDTYCKTTIMIQRSWEQHKVKLVQLVVRWSARKSVM